MFWCRCDCGTLKRVPLQALRAATTRSCGCLVRETITKHGLNGHPLYLMWWSAIDRCHNEGSQSYHLYGARGIRVHPDWHGTPEGLKRFIAWVEANLGPRPEGTYPGGQSRFSLDRIDNDGNYEPGNLRWATVSQQARNRRLPRPKPSRYMPAETAEEMLRNLAALVRLAAFAEIDIAEGVAWLDSHGL